MLIKDYISHDFPVFDANDQAEAAADLAKDYGYSHIIVAKDGVLVGNIRNEFLLEAPYQDIKSQDLHLEKFAVLEDGNIIDTLKIFHTYHTNIIPVIDKSEKYLGYISSEDVFTDFSKYPLFSETGALITLEISLKSYSLTEIAKIVETNNARFYGAFISDMNEEMIQVTIKISSENLNSIDETFERYGYTIISKSFTDEKDELIKDRFGFFQKYMEI